MSNPQFKALEDAVGLVAQLADAFVKAPKPLTAASLSNLFPLIGGLETILGEASQVLPELKEVDLTESESLLAVLASNLGDLSGEEEAVIEASTQVLTAIVSLVEALKGSTPAPAAAPAK